MVFKKRKLPQASLRPFRFLTANPGKPRSDSRDGAPSLPIWKGAWPSRPCGDCSTYSRHSHRNQRSRPQHTGGTHCAPLLEPKSKRLLVLNQIVKKVGTPRRRCPKHQARRAVSGIQRRLQPPRCATTAWQVRLRETDGDGAPIFTPEFPKADPYLFFRNSMHRGHCFFEIRLCSAKEGGHGRLGRVETGLLFLAPCPLEPSSRPQHTGETRCAPLLKSKSKRPFLY